MAETDDYKLCYIDGSWAYFTSDMAEQWGDDWDDAPYEHNAETPYSHKTDVIKVAYSGGFDRPCDNHTNSPWSVEQINAGAIAWLRTHEWCEETVVIPAGTTLTEFRRLVRRAGGKVFEEVQP